MLADRAQREFRAPGDRAAHKRRLRAALVVTSTFFVVEVGGGFLSGSLALLADAAHMFADVAALLLAYAAMSMAERAPSTRYSFGLYRAEILAAFVNAEVLLLTAGSILFEAYRRFQAPTEIATGIMMLVAAGGLVANLISVAFLQGSHRESLNLRAAYVEVLGDAIASAAVVATSIVIWFTGYTRLDTVASAAIAVLVVLRTIPLLRESSHILLEGVPLDVNLEALSRALREIPGVVEVHDLHVWTLTSDLHTASLHVRVEDDGRRQSALTAVQRVLRDRAGVDHATIQVEWGPAGACTTAELRF
jgi:cobalt-zinc-cadmium efflux system protein